MKDFTDAILNQLTASCAECGITNDIIDMQSFRCFPDSPSHVTYRARLQGTSETDSGSLISLIEKWVSNGADIIVTGLIMTVDTKCSVQISSFGEEECSEIAIPHSTPPSTVDSTLNPDPSTGNTVSPGAIIGGIVAVILIIAITVSIVFIMKQYCGNRKNDR